MVSDLQQLHKILDQLDYAARIVHILKFLVLIDSLLIMTRYTNRWFDVTYFNFIAEL